MRVVRRPKDGGREARDDLCRNMARLYSLFAPDFERVLSRPEVERRLGGAALRAYDEEERVFALKPIGDDVLTEVARWRLPVEVQVGLVFGLKGSRAYPYKFVSPNHGLCLTSEGLAKDKVVEGIIGCEPMVRKVGSYDLLVSSLRLNPKNVGRAGAVLGVREVLMETLLERFVSSDAYNGDVLFNTWQPEDRIFANRFMGMERQEGLRLGGGLDIYLLPREHVPKALSMLRSQPTRGESGGLVKLVHKTDMRLVPLIARFGLISEVGMSTLNDMEFEAHEEAMWRLFAAARGENASSVALVFSVPNNLVFREVLSDYSIAKTPETTMTVGEWESFLKGAAKLNVKPSVIRLFRGAWNDGALVRLPSSFIDLHETEKLNTSLAKEYLTDPNDVKRLRGMLS